MKGKIVVMARFDYPARETKQFQVKKGDFGLLEWRAHQRHPRFLEPVVVWDKDRERKARKTIWSSLTVAGVQTRETRITLTDPFLLKAR